MSKDNFRRVLRSESEQWWREGLIDAGLYERLSERYQFSEIESTSSNRFIAILLGLGGILLGLGAITLVAANWQDWSRTVRIIVIFSAFIAVNSAGFYCWRRASWRRLGIGLLLAGALVMGANIGLMSQMFHQSGSLSGLYIVWGLGVLAMAYSLRLTPLGILSWILVALGYRELAMSSWFWGQGAASNDWIVLLQLYLPLWMTPLYLPLAHWCRSRVLYVLWGVSRLTLRAANGSLVHWTPFTLAAGFSLIPALLWVYHSQFWQRPTSKNSKTGKTPLPKTNRSPVQQRLGAAVIEMDSFQPLGQSLAIWIVSFALYGYSFHWVWTENWLPDDFSGSMARSFVLGLMGLSAIALYGIWQWVNRDFRPTEPPSLWMKTPIFALVLALTGLGIGLHYQGSVEYIGVVLMNVLLAFIGFAMLHDGVLMGVRHRFWGGMGIVVISLMSRMFEYDTELILKALVLVACGLAVILAGLWFEKQTKLISTKELIATAEKG